MKLQMKDLETKRLSKLEQYELLLRIRKGETLSDSELDQLILAHVPKTSKPKTAIHWVAQAVGKKDHRKWLNYIYNDGTRYIASDGHRLHILHEASEPGYYCPNTLLPIDYDHPYCGFIDRAIPSDSHMVEATEPTWSEEEREIVRFGDKKFRRKYYEQAMNCPGHEMDSFKVDTGDGRFGKLKISSGRTLAVIMGQSGE